jgi:hypothetical protein
MRDHSKYKVSAPDMGLMHIDLSFPAGCDENGVFSVVDNVDPAGASDGYLIDAYGAGVHSSASLVISKGLRGAGVFGVQRVSVGQYDILLRESWRACMSQQASLVLGVGSLTATAGARSVVFKSPMMEAVTGADGKVRSRVRVQVLDKDGAAAELKYDDRVNVSLVIKTASNK